ncbi:ATP-dependent RNA helicase RhlE [Calycomorphotria hydatis]|uniref:ATP-dependent RNA helicase RhlE n=2 Tax=Calycomorphotria hydatis TaxID=2528027 RepID=A0A517TBN0_9PLAN|nr:ATP-dependent RNA helicase RhlE [Calycomorphotria hydatis]
MKFSDLGLHELVLRVTEPLGYVCPTPIQAEAIPVILTGRDVVGCAQTGTGKTAAFTLPMLCRLIESLPEKPIEQQAAPKDNRDSKGRRKSNRPPSRPGKPQALVLSPTRELAAQIKESLIRYGKHVPLRYEVVSGGVSYVPQIKGLNRGVDVLVATPGRLIDLMEKGHVDLSETKILVLDEADQMLDMGFLPALKQIVSAVPAERQTVMFSATMPPKIRRLADEWLTDPTSIQVAPVATPAERIVQRVHMVDTSQKSAMLLRYLKETPRNRTIVFSRTKHGADKLVKIIQQDGFRAAAIHGNKSQNARTRTLRQFKGNSPPILIATDIAARGLDINDVSHIINYDLPDTPENYVHRIGRTARAGAEGTAISFCARGERKLLHAIERLMNCRIEVEQGGDRAEPDTSKRHKEPLRAKSEPLKPKRRRRRPSKRAVKN